METHSWLLRMLADLGQCGTPYSESRAQEREYVYITETDSREKDLYSAFLS